MQFACPGNLLLLLLIVVFLFLRIFSERKYNQDIRSFSTEKMFFRISDFDRKARRIRYFLFLGGYAFLVIALSRPQFGQKLQEIKQSGADIVIAVDVSESMSTTDLGLARLAIARKCISSLLSRLSGNRVGIIAFAGTAFWQCPLTFDLAGANLFLDIMDKNLLPLGGTNIPEAIQLAVQGLKKSAPGSSAIVLITDGENLQGEIDPAIDLARRSGIKIYCLGIGTTAGEPIPLVDEHGNFTGYKKDRKGNVVVSRLNEELLRQISQQTGGDYWPVATNVEGTVAQLLDNLSGLARTRLSSRFLRMYEERYQIFLFLAFGLLLLEMLVSERQPAPVTEKKV